MDFHVHMLSKAFFINSTSLGFDLYKKPVWQFFMGIFPKFLYNYACYISMCQKFYGDQFLTRDHVMKI